MEIGFIGLGKLGKECAEVMAERHNVTGYDIADVNPEGEYKLSLPYLQKN